MLYGWWKPVETIRIWLCFKEKDHQSRQATHLGIEAPTETCTRHFIVSDSCSCCSESEPKNQNMTVSCTPDRADTVIQIGERIANARFWVAALHQHGGS